MTASDTAPYIASPDETSHAAWLGGKGAALAALRESGLPVPAWFALTPAAFDASLTTTQRAALECAAAAEDAAGLDAALAGVRLDSAIQVELGRALAALCPNGERVAVRSSAVDEDGMARSFAGQLESYLDVSPDQVVARVAAVWRSAFGARVLAYRRASGLAGLPQAPAVLVQRMVRADWSGVAFSADPVSGRRGVAVVSAVAGLGDQLVSGACDGTTWHVARDGAVIEERAPDGGEVLAVSAIRAVADLARACERHFGRPQDIEWAIAGGQVALLQSRPITTLAGRADPDGAFQIWDNSNIAESYGGMTTPMTFSYARSIYEAVYRQLCRVMGAPESIILEHDNTFRHMLGFMRGRVYYNLLNWYRLLALLPGFTVNRRFMEQMMGVKEGLPESIVAELARATWRDRLNDTRRLALAVGGLLANYVSLPRRIVRFERRLDGALADPTPDFHAMRPDELVAYYRVLERRLITHWDAPLLNDLFAMLFYGLLRSLAVKWCGDARGTLQNDLVAGEGGMISAEPAARVRAMAALAVGNDHLIATLRTGNRAGIQRALVAHPALRTAYDDYLARFADRCMEELKLESQTLRDDPLPLLRAVGHLAARLGADGPEAGESGHAARAQRQRAERRVRAALARHPLRRLLFAWVLRGARRHVLARENLRFERTRVFGRVRLILSELGKRFYALDLLEQPRDIFYLELGEALGFVEGTATSADLKGLVALRQAELARYREQEPPADRFATRGIVAQGNTYQPEHAARDTAPKIAASERRGGTGCYPGVVRGPVRVVRDPRQAQVRAGEVLVAERTDPGWIMLFPAAAGVLVERGSLLSHSAIVARELGIPTIVAIGGLTAWLCDGDWVEMDGAAGTVARIAPPETPSTVGMEEVSRHA